jgi:hypothetical protein
LDEQDAKRAYNLASKATEVLTGIEDEGQGMAFAAVASSLTNLDQRALARFYVEQGLSVAEEMFRPDVETSLYDTRAKLAARDDQRKLAINAAQKALEMARASNDMEATIRQLEQLGKLHKSYGEWPQAADQFRQALRGLSDLPVEVGTPERRRMLDAWRVRLTQSLTDCLRALPSQPAARPL